MTARVIWNKDVVLVGTIARMDTLTRHIGLACSGPDSVALDAVDYTLTKLEVLQGTVEDSSVTVSCLRNLVFESGKCAPGTRVLFWGLRLCEDRWRMWGRFAVVLPSGRLDAGYVDSDLFRSASIGSSEVDLATLIRRAPPGRPGTLGKLLTASAIGLGRVTSIERPHEGRWTITLDSLGWIWGSAPSLSRCLEYDRSRDCALYFSVGDTLLIPASQHQEDERIVLAGCPGLLRTKNRYVPALAVPIQSMRRALKQENGRFVQKEVLSRE